LRLVPVVSNSSDDPESEDPNPPKMRKPMIPRIIDEMLAKIASTLARLAELRAGVGATDGAIVGELVGNSVVAVDNLVGGTDGLSEGGTVGGVDRVSLGDTVGGIEGSLVGGTDGVSEGDSVGGTDGVSLGDPVGEIDGVLVGGTDGVSEGACLEIIGYWVIVSRLVF